VSRGPGRCQRRVLAELEKAPGHRMNRLQLEEVLVVEEGYHESNILRAIRGLARMYLVDFADRHRKEDAVVSLPRTLRVPLSDDEVFALLAKASSGEQP